MALVSILPEQKSENTIPFKTDAKKKVGSISFNSSIDDENFYLCDENNIAQYYQVHPKFKEGSKSISEYFRDTENALRFPSSFSGNITVRFIVNCRGETDRFRVLATDLNYKAVEAKGSLGREIITRVQEMGIWTPGSHDGLAYDAYKHITLKVENGVLKQIMP